MGNSVANPKAADSRDRSVSTAARRRVRRPAALILDPQNVGGTSLCLGNLIVAQSLAKLAERLGTLTDQMRTEQGVLLRLAETQSQLKPLLTRMADVDLNSGGGMDEATKGHIRNLDFHMERLVGEIAGGRDQTVQEIRSEIRLLARTIAALAEETEG